MLLPLLPVQLHYVQEDCQLTFHFHKEMFKSFAASGQWSSWPLTKCNLQYAVSVATKPWVHGLTRKFQISNYKSFYKHTCKKMSSGCLLCNTSCTTNISGFSSFVTSGPLWNLILQASTLGFTSLSSSSNISCLTVT